MKTTKAEAKRQQVAHDMKVRAQRAFDELWATDPDACRYLVDTAHAEAAALVADTLQGLYVWTLESFQNSLKCAQERLAKWTARVAENPAYAFQWADSAFGDAAVVKVYTQYLGIAERKGLYFAMDAARDQLIREFTSTSRSTSPSSNLMNDHVREVLASFAHGRSL